MKGATWQHCSHIRLSTDSMCCQECPRWPYSPWARLNRAPCWAEISTCALTEPGILELNNYDPTSLVRVCARVHVYG